MAKVCACLPDLVCRGTALGSGQRSQENEFVLAEVYQGTCWAGTLYVKEGTAMKSAPRLWLDTLKLFISVF